MGEKVSSSARYLLKASPGGLACHDTHHCSGKSNKPGTLQSLYHDKAPRGTARTILNAIVDLKVTLRTELAFAVQQLSAFRCAQCGSTSGRLCVYFAVLIPCTNTPLSRCKCTSQVAPEGHTQYGSFAGGGSRLGHHCTECESFLCKQRRQPRQINMIFILEGAGGLSA
jgi:hypothetical protein